MVALRSSLFALFVVLGACDVGMVPAGGGGGGGGGPDAGAGGGSDLTAKQKATFGTVITPLVSNRCTTCHGAIAPDFTSYDSLLAKYKTPPGSGSLLVTKGNHEGFTNFFNATEQMKVANWIDNGTAN